MTIDLLHDVALAGAGVLALAGVPFAAAGAYLGLLGALSRRTTAPAPGGSTRFDVVVPAHDEALGISATVASLLAVDYPRDRFRVLVVADNCTDDTAARAERAGAMVLVREDAARRGKGYALELAYARSAADGFADAVAVVDADTLVSPNLLGAFAARIERGASCVQAHYGVRNLSASWRTRLMGVALAMYHTARSLGRERLGVSCGLRGNGMGFTHDVLRRVPHHAYSVVEDVEQGVALGIAGERVRYAPEAVVLGEMPATADAARSQRERWERGRWALVRRYVPILLSAARRQFGSRGFRGALLPLDLAADLLVPPLATVAAGTLLGAGATAGAAVALYEPGVTPAASLTGSLAACVLVGAALWGTAVLGVAVYVARGCQLSEIGARVVLDLLAAPAYVAWKLTLVLHPTKRASTDWIRTRRVGETVIATPPPPADTERAA